MPVVGDLLLFWAVLIMSSAAGAFLVTRFVPQDAKLSHRPITQQTLAVTGMMFAILLGFFIGQAWDHYTSAKTDIVNEADALGAVFRDARGLNETDRVRIRQLCRKYTDSVINDEWPLLRETRPSSKSQDIMNELWNAALSVTPTSAREQVVYQSFITGMNDLGRYRRIRTAAIFTGLGLTFWIIIGVGASALVTLTFLYAPDNKIFHGALLACILTPITFNVYLLADYSHPFSGLVTVRPVMFEALQRKIMSQDDSAPHFLDSKATNASQ